ncbi:MAG: hypothetical protein NVS4B1_09200 [Ktedonobacteraceae bacterium]
MLEQQEHLNGNSLSDAQSMTQLEGIRNKVFIDRYSLKDASGKPLELYPEHTWARVACGIAAVEKTEEKQAYWEKRFYEVLTNFQFVPGGRILAGAGSGHQVTFYNCMPPDQEVLTADGYRPISQIEIGDLVVTHRNRLRPVLHRFERETEETLYIIRPKKVGYDDLRLTGEHKVHVVRSEWVNKHKSRDGLCLQHEIGFLLKKLNPEIMLPLHIMLRNALPTQYTSRITFRDMRRRMASSLKRQHAVITDTYQIGARITSLMTIWNSIRICATC